MRSNSRLTSLLPRYWKTWFVAILLMVSSLVGLSQTDSALSQSSRSSAPVKPSAPNAPTTPSQTPSPKGVDKPFLKLGSQGTEVTEVQALLKLLGYYTGAINGVYEEITASAVSQFQKAAGLSPDGIVGTDTWTRLLPPSPSHSSASPSLQAPANTSTPLSNSTATSEALPAPGVGKPTSSTATAKPTTTTPPSAKPATAGDGERAGSEIATLPILRIGMKGPAVSGLQERLRALGYLKGGADGVFGPETQAAVKAAQRVLKLEADGVVGSETWLGLLR